MTAGPNYTEPAYVQGQIDSLRVTIQVLMRFVRPEHFFPQALAEIEDLRARTLARPIADAKLSAIDHFEAWLKEQQKILTEIAQRAQ